MTAEHRDEESEETEEQLVRVADVWDESAATLLCDFLNEQGIRATAVSAQIPAFGLIERAGSGHWGYVEVLEHDAERAKVLIRDFYAGRPEGGNGEAAG
jgi:hypothetical protein